MLFTPLLFSFVEVLSTRQESYRPATAGALQSLEMKVLKKRLQLRGQSPAYGSYMTDLRLTLETSKAGQYQDYGIVQFIKGCKWISHWDGRAITKHLSIARNHMGNPVIFKHQHFEVDTDSLDPVYHSYQGHRFALWRWNESPSNDDPESAHYVYHREPPHGTIFLTDMPGTSFGSQDMQGVIQEAQNSTLEFKTCLFSLSDLPQATDARGANIPMDKAIKCFSWEDKWVFDFRQQKMTSPQSIDQVCL